MIWWAVWKLRRARSRSAIQHGIEEIEGSQNPWAISTLVGLLDHPDTDIRIDARSALVRAGAPAIQLVVPRAFRCPDWAGLKYWADIVADIVHKEDIASSIPAKPKARIRQALRSPAAETRRAAIRLLGAIEPSITRESFDLLLLGLKDPEPLVAARQRLN